MACTLFTPDTFIAPLTDRDAREMVESLRAAPLLRGVRGEKAVSIDAYVDALLRVDRLVSDFHGLVELDVNPFMLGETALKIISRRPITDRMRNSDMTRACSVRWRG